MNKYTIEAIRRMDGKDAKKVLEAVVNSIKDELKNCKEAPKHVDNLHDSVVFNDALLWCLEVIEQMMNFSVNVDIQFKKEG